MFSNLHFYRTKGDGNCLFRACSKRLTGTDDLHEKLRDLTSIELFMHAEYYTDHPYILGKRDIFATENSAFSACLSDSALSGGYDRRSVLSRCLTIKRQAEITSRLNSYSPLMTMLGLASVIGVDILTIQGDYGEEDKHSRLHTGIIKPREYHDKFANSYQCELPVTLMWVRDPGSYLLKKENSKINHIVPLAPKPINMNRTGFSKKHVLKETTIPTPSKRVKTESKILICFCDYP